MRAIKARLSCKNHHSMSLIRDHLFAGILGNGLCALRDRMLGQFTREHETDGRLYLSGREGVFLVVLAQLPSLRSDLVEGVTDQRSHDHHGLLADAGLRVHLLQHLEDVGAVGLCPLLLALALALAAGGLCRLGRFLRNHFQQQIKITERTQAK